MTLSEKQEALCTASRWDYSDLKALFLNCTLKRSPEQSHTEGLIDLSKAILEKNGVGVEVLRLVCGDHLDQHALIDGLDPLSAVGTARQGQEQQRQVGAIHDMIDSITSRTLPQGQSRQLSVDPIGDTLQQIAADRPPQVSAEDETGA